MKPVFMIRRPDEEHMRFYVNGVQVGEANHDNDGWAGMDTASSLFERIAEELGVEVITDESEDE